MWEEAIPVWEEDPDEEDRIVLCDGLPVGWIGVNSLLTDMPYVKILIILPEYQGRGAGTALNGVYDKGIAEAPLCDLLAGADKLSDNAFFVNYSCIVLYVCG